jgi:ABC-type branched-subunit amino acid transport system permease subunit
MYGGNAVIEPSPENATEPQIGKWVMLGMLYSLPIVIAFGYFGELQRGETAWVCIGIFLTAIRFRWELRKHKWFWLLIATVAILDVPLIFYFPWPKGKYPGYALLPLGMLDYFFLYGCINLAERIANAGSARPK